MCPVLVSGCASRAPSGATCCRRRVPVVVCIFTPGILQASVFTVWSVCMAGAAGQRCVCCSCATGQHAAGVCAVSTVNTRVNVHGVCSSGPRLHAHCPSAAGSPTDHHMSGELQKLGSCAA